MSVWRLRALACSAAILSISMVPLQATAAPTLIASAQLPAESFAALPALEDAKLSPSGTRIAAKVAIRGETSLMIITPGGGAPVIIPTNDTDVLDFIWVNDEWLVLRIGMKTPWKYGGDIYVTRALAMKADGSESQQLLHKIPDLGQNASNIIWTSHDGSPRIMLTAQRGFTLSDGFYPEVYEVDVSRDKASLVSRSFQGVFDWVADHDGNLRMGIGYSVDGKKRRVVYRSSSGGGLKEIESPVATSESMETPDIFLPDDKAISYTRGDDGYLAVYEFDPVRVALGTKLYGSDGYDIGAVRFHPNGRDVAGVGRLEDGFRIEWVHPDFKALQATINAKTRSDKAQIFSWSDDLSRALFDFGDANMPGATYLYDGRTGNISRLGFANPKLEMAQLHSVQTINYKARDGLEIEAVLTLPTGKSGNLPLIMLPHGGPHSRDYKSWNWMAQFMADRGYAVLQPNYRGSSGYGLKFAQAGEGEWGLKMQDDLVDGIAALAEQGLIDKGRVCIVGGSYGGYAAMRAAQRDADHYRCAVSYAGVSDLDKLLKNNGRDVLFLGSRKEWLSRQAPDFNAVSPVNTPEATRIPILLMHGAKDKRVDVDQSRDMAKALQGAGKDFTYIEQPKADHFFSREEDRLQFLQELEKFLTKHNPA